MSEMVQVYLQNNTDRASMNVPNSTTIAEAIERSELNFFGKMINANGRTLSAEDLGKSFAELFDETTPKFWVSSVVKGDNAATVIVVGGKMVLKTEVEADTFARIEKEHPEAMSLTDEEGNVTFAISTNDGCCADGTINKYGAILSENVDANGHSSITVDVTGMTNDEIMAKYAYIVKDFNSVEAQVLEAAVEDVEAVDSIRNLFTFA